MNKPGDSSFVNGLYMIVYSHVDWDGYWSSGKE
jgi:hypothetical protein